MSSHWRALLDSHASTGDRRGSVVSPWRFVAVVGGAIGTGLALLGGTFGLLALLVSFIDAGDLGEAPGEVPVTQAERAGEIREGEPITPLRVYRGEQAGGFFNGHGLRVSVSLFRPGQLSELLAQLHREHPEYVWSECFAGNAFGIAGPFDWMKIPPDFRPASPWSDLRHGRSPDGSRELYVDLARGLLLDAVQ